MSIIKKFLGAFNLDDDYEEDDFFEEDDELEEEKPKKTLFSSRTKKDEDDDFGSANKVTPIRQNRRASMEVCVIKPTAVDDEREVAETLLSGKTVILNLEGIDLEIAQRIIDFISGATFAISGNLQKVSNFIFLVTPTNVEISGDLQDLLNSSFDFSAFKSRY